MTTTPDVLEDLDFPTPELTPPSTFEAFAEALQRLIETALPAITAALAAMSEIEFTQFTRDLTDDDHYCWCSPSRGMLFADVPPVEFHMWYPTEGKNE